MQRVSLGIDDNPLAPIVVAEQLPALCAQGGSNDWDGGGCFGCDGEDP